MSGGNTPGFGQGLELAAPPPPHTYTQTSPHARTCKAGPGILRPGIPPRQKPKSINKNYSKRHNPFVNRFKLNTAATKRLKHQKQATGAREPQRAILRNGERKLRVAEQAPKLGRLHHTPRHLHRKAGTHARPQSSGPVQAGRNTPAARWLGETRRPRARTLRYA